MKIKYDTHLVGFVDVMGFKELLTDNRKNRDKLGKYFEHIKNDKDLEDILGEGNLKIMAVSDSVVYSIRLPKKPDRQLKTAAYFLKKLAIVQYNLAVGANIWTRGGVSVGNLQMDPSQNFIVGQAFVDALNLEETANYPRIIIDPKVIGFFGKTPHDFCEIMRSEYSAPIMDFIYDNPLSLTPWPNDYVQLDWFGWGLDRVKDSVELALEKISGQASIDLNMTEFFKDFQYRQNLNTNLFLKCQLLLRYFLQSRYQYHLRGGSAKKDHVIELTRKLAELTGKDMTNPPSVLLLE